MFVLFPFLRFLFQFTKVLSKLFDFIVETIYFHWNFTVSRRLALRAPYLLKNQLIQPYNC